MNRPSVPAPPAPTKYRLTSPRGAGTKLATRTWAPTSKPKALVLIVHGAGWHSGYYRGLAEHLTQQGIFVAAYDQPSCGYSAQDREAPHGCTHIYSMDEIVEEVYEAVDWAIKEAGTPKLPLFLIGESFGAVQALSAAFECQGRNVPLAGVILLGGLIRAAKEVLPPNLVIKILVWLSQYYAKFKLPAADYSATFDEAFGDKEWAAVARSDPAVNVSPQFTLGAAASILSGGENVLDRARSFPVPLLAIHANRDGRTQWEAVQEFVDRAGTSKAEMLLIDSDGHQLLQDKPDVTKQVIDKVTVWINEILEG